MVADRAGRQLHTVADDVVLIGQDIQRIGPVQRLHPALRHGEGVVGEVDLLLFLGPLVHGEVDDPAQAKLVLGDQLQLSPDAGAGEAGELVGFARIAGDEEDSVATFKI